MKNGLLKGKLQSFGAQMAFFYLAAGLAIIVLFSGVVYTVTSDIFVKEAVSKTEMAIESGVEGVESYIRYAKGLLQIYARDSAVIDLAASGDVEAPQNVLEKMAAIRESDSHIFEVFILRSSGETIRSGEGKPMGVLQQIDAGIPCLSSERADRYGHADPWTVTIGVPITSEDGEELGMLVMDLDYCLFMHTLSGFDMGKNGSIAILNDSGTLVFHTDKTILSKENGGAAFLKQSQRGYDMKTNQLTHSVAILGTDWTMVGTASLDGLSVLKRQISDMVIFTGILLFVALLAITATISKKLTTPLSRLACSMEDIKSLAELTVHANEISEAVTLTESYNRMIQRIKQLMQELEEKQGELRKHELDALTSQINPHFLYNTLDTIVWLAEFRDNDKIIALTKSLAAFFRLSLNGGRAVVSVQDEFEHVKQYLFIQKERYGDKLTYSFAAEEDALACMVPKIVLQPIVENAIYHGIKPMEGAGHIQIEAHTEGANLVLRVRDNGVGLAVQNSSCPSDKKNGGVGLCNVEGRIKLYYGQEASIKIKSAPGEGTVVTLNLKTELLEIKKMSVFQHEVLE